MKTRHMSNVFRDPLNTVLVHSGGKCCNMRHKSICISASVALVGKRDNAPPGVFVIGRPGQNGYKSASLWFPRLQLLCYCFLSLLLFLSSTSASSHESSIDLWHIHSGRCLGTKGNWSAARRFSYLSCQGNRSTLTQGVYTTFVQSDRKHISVYLILS